MARRFNHKIYVTFYIVVTLVLIIFNGVAILSQEPLKYNVSVDAMTIPLFVVDIAGKPVFDLKQEELQIVVNEKPMEIIDFNRYEFTYDQEVNQNIVDKDKEGITVKLPARVIFIIIDNVFNSSSGLRRSKKIAQDLIKKGTQADHFILLENTPGGGLKYITGPSSDSEKLMKEIAKIVPNHTIWTKLREMSDSNLTNITQGGIGSRPPDIRGIGKIDEDYRSAIKRFSHILSQFQYALKTITRPKMVFLISEGISNVAIQEIGEDGKVFLRPFLLNYLKDIVKAVNAGGSVLYTINPQDNPTSIAQDIAGKNSLRFLAETSGGKYFEGSDPGIIIKNIQQTIAAYYELGFSIPSQLGDNFTVTVKCSRKDVQVHTLTHTERNKPYENMDQVQKKIFALDVATGGSWSRMSGRVMKVNVKPLAQKNGEYIFSLGLPKEMCNHNLDIFFIHMDPDSEAVNINSETQKVNDYLELKMNSQENKKKFMVIIEPTGPWCLYIEVKQ